MTSAAASLSQLLNTEATVELYDETDGVFGELIPPEKVIASLRHEADPDEFVGKIDETTANNKVPEEFVAVRSLTYAGGGRQEIALEFNNTSSQAVNVRWIDAQGHNPSTHIWTVEPSSSMVQYTEAGHLFVMSVVTQAATDLFEGTAESVLGAYRPIKKLPSGLAHCVLIQEEGNANGWPSPTFFVLESILLDKTKADALIVAAAALDPAVGAGVPRKRIQASLSTLQTIVLNVMKHPTEEKYRKLRLSNSKIKRDITTAWGAMHLLNILGFHKEKVDVGKDDSKASLENEKEKEPGDCHMEEFLVLQEPRLEDNIEGVCKRANELIVLLQSRVDPQFVADLAPATPWQKPLPVNDGAADHQWNTYGTHFISDEERWARAERGAQFRRSGGHRPPPPGHAPSSNGPWGR